MHVTNRKSGRKGDEKMDFFFFFFFGVYIKTGRHEQKPRSSGSNPRLEKFLS